MNWYKSILTPILIIVLLSLAGYTIAITTGGENYFPPVGPMVNQVEQSTIYDIELNKQYLVYTLRYLNKPEYFRSVFIRNIDDKFIVLETERGKIIWVPLTNIAKIIKYNAKETN